MEAKKETQQAPKPLSSSLKRFFGVGDFGFGIMANIDTFYATYFFTDVAKFSLAATTTMTTISAIIDAILSVFYGPFMNKTKPRKWGRYRSWLIMTPWMVPFLYAAQFIRVGSGVAAMIICTLAMITSRIAWNLPFIANISMINIAGKTQEDRMTLSSNRMVYQSLASVIYSFAGPAVVLFFAGMLGEANAYAGTAFAFACLMVAGYFAHFKMFEGYEMTGEEELAMLAAKAKETGTEQPKVKAMKVLTSNSSLLWLFMNNVMKFALVFLVNGLAVYYFKYVSNNQGLMTTFVLIANLLAVVGSYISKYIVAKLTAKRTVVIGLLISAAAGAVSYMFYNNTTIVIAAMCVLMFTNRMTNACDPELYAKCARVSGKKFGYDVTGTVMGFMTVPIKVGVITRGLLIAAVLAVTSIDPNVDPAMATDAMKSGISAGFMLIPAAVSVIGAACLAFGYKITDKDLA